MNCYFALVVVLVFITIQLIDITFLKPDVTPDE